MRYISLYFSYFINKFSKKILYTEDGEEVCDSGIERSLSGKTVPSGRKQLVFRIAHSKSQRAAGQ